MLDRITMNSRCDSDTIWLLYFVMDGASYVMGSFVMY